MKDFYTNVVHDQVVDPAVITSDTDGASVDLLGYDRVVFYALVGESGDSLSGALYTELEVEESADDSSFTDVADADLTVYVAGNNDGTFAKIDAAAEDDAVYMTEYRGSKRYVRPVINITGTHTNGTPIGIVALRIGAQYKAVTQT
jgi:hypothetical protein